MIEKLTSIVEKVTDKITEGSSMERTGYDSPNKLRNELMQYIEELRKGRLDCIEELHTHFLPTSTFQEHSLSNNWAEEYLELSEQFDKIYSVLKNTR